MQPGQRRRQLDETLRAAYGQGLLSDGTFVSRVDHLLTEPTIDPRRLVGDLTVGASRGPWARVRRVTDTIATWPQRRTAALLALDWTGGAAERLSIGRDVDSDIVLGHDTVSRHHAELLWGGGGWVLHDLGSRNGTTLNGRAVVRARLHPGDLVRFATTALRVD